MNRNVWTCSFGGGVLLLVGALPVGTLNGQQPPPPPGLEYHAEAFDEGGPGGPIGEKIELLGFEGLRAGKIVKGTPFSATANSETTQTLQDGTTIHRTSSTALYRDSEGRSRREVTLSGFGFLQTSGKPRMVITINDPVARVHYLMDPEKKVAHKMGPPKGVANGEVQSFKQKMQQHLANEEASGEVKKESLGTQAIHGLKADGTRITRTIPTGQIGNDRPIQIVFERWYSPDLQVVVKSTRTDPRFGTTTYALSNVQRTEPAAALFTVPADYTVQEGGPLNFLRKFHGGQPGGGPGGVSPPPPGV
jgi:hypothetical protein